MKKLLTLLMALALCLCVAACGGDTEAPADTEEPAETETDVNEPVETADNEGAEITDEQLAALTEAYNVVAPLYNEAYTTAEANGWLADETTAAEIEAMNSTLGFIGTALTEDLTMLDGSDFDALTETLLTLEAPLTELVERVSVPYEG